MATLHHADGDFDSSETACGESVGYIHTETDDAVTICDPKEYGSRENLRGDTVCKACKEALE